jgi:hypothetical protein
MTIQDIMMKPVHDIIQRYHRKPRMHPIPHEPEERVHGQLVTISSKVSPENKATSKAEYTNTQQGLPDFWYILS